MTGFWEIVSGWWGVFQFPFLLIIAVLAFALVSQLIKDVLKTVRVLVRGYPPISDEEAPLWRKAYMKTVKDLSQGMRKDLH